MSLQVRNTAGSINEAIDRFEFLRPETEPSSSTFHEHLDRDTKADSTNDDHDCRIECRFPKQANSEEPTAATTNAAAQPAEPAEEPSGEEGSIELTQDSSVGTSTDPALNGPSDDAVADVESDVDSHQAGEELDSILIQANQAASTESGNSDDGTASAQDLEQVENTQNVKASDQLSGSPLNARLTDEAGAGAGSIELSVSDPEVAGPAKGTQADTDVTASIAGVAAGATKVSKTVGSNAESNGEAEPGPANDSSRFKLPTDLATPAKPWEANQTSLEAQLADNAILATSHHRQAAEGQDLTNLAEPQSEASEESLKTVGAGITEERRADASTTRPVEDRHMVRLNASQQRRFVQRVSRAFELAQQRGGEIRLRLSPPALGSLKVELKIEGKQMAARLEAENQAAKNLLLEHLPQLRDRLAEQGFSIETFEVDLHHDETGDAQRESDAQDAADRERSRGDRNRVEQLDRDDSLGTEINHLESNSPIEGQINVIV